MPGSHYLRALPAGTLRLSSAARFAAAVEAASRRSYSAATTANSNNTTTSTSSATTPPPPTPSGPAPGAAPNAGSKHPKRGPFFVARTPSNKLPVYEELKKGGTQPSTLLRKIEGDAHTLKQELIQQLRLEADKVTVNPATNHIRIKVREQRKPPAPLGPQEPETPRVTRFFVADNTVPSFAQRLQGRYKKEINELLANLGF